MGATSKQGEEHRDELVFFPSAAEKLPAVSSFFLASGGGGGSLLRPQLLRDFLFASYGYLSLSPSLSAVLLWPRSPRREGEEETRVFRGKRDQKHVFFFEVARLPPGFLLPDTPLRESLSLSPPSLDLLNQTKRNSDPLRQRPVRRRQPRRRRRRRRVRAKGKREGEKRGDGLSERRPGNSLF